MQTRRWRSAVVGGIAISAAVHVGLLALWTGRDPAAPVPGARPGPSPMQAIAWHAAPAPAVEAPGAGILRATRSDTEVEPVDAPESPTEADDPLESLLPAPSVVTRGDGELPPSRAEMPAMHLQTVSVAAPASQVTRPAGIWPLIRNPGEIVRYLRQRYNPVLLASGATGHVKVELWIDHGGDVRTSTIHESSGHPALDEIALALLTVVADYDFPSERRSWTPGSILVSVPFTGPW